MQDNSVCSYQGVVPDFHTSEYFGASSDVHVSSQHRRAEFGAAYPYCHLLEYLTIGSDHCLWKNDYSVGMQQEQPTAYLAVKRYIGSCDYTPKMIF